MVKHLSQVLSSKTLILQFLVKKIPKFIYKINIYMIYDNIKLQ
jgi:hypothetical protein